MDLEIDFDLEMHFDPKMDWNSDQKISLFLTKNDANMKTEFHK